MHVGRVTNQCPDAQPDAPRSFGEIARESIRRTASNLGQDAPMCVILVSSRVTNARPRGVQPVIEYIYNAVLKRLGPSNGVYFEVIRPAIKLVRWLTENAGSSV